MKNGRLFVPEDAKREFIEKFDSETAKKPYRSEGKPGSGNLAGTCKAVAAKNF